MFTLSVIIFDVIALIWSGVRILKKSKATNYHSGNYLGIGLVLVGIAILLYGIRSVIIQFGPSFYWADENLFYRPGTVIHSIGIFFAFLFVYKEFAAKTFSKVTIIPVLGSLLYLAFIFAFGATNRGVNFAPLEPFKFVMTNYPWVSPMTSRIFLYITVGVPLIILGIFIYNALKQKKAKSLIFGVGTPVLAFLGIVGIWKPAMLPFVCDKIYYEMFFIAAIVFVILSIIVSERKKVMVKALLYGLGISFQGLFIPLCIFISPIFARLGYGIGALMVYKAFGMRVE